MNYLTTESSPKFGAEFNKISLQDIDDNTLDLAMELYNCIPTSILKHYSSLNNMGTLDICLMVMLSNKEWHMRLTHPMTYVSHEDIIHDFVGLANDDEHFLPRI